MGSLDELLGTLLVGTWISCALFLLELIWTIRYYQHCSNGDPMHIKIIVAVVIGIDLISLIVKCLDTYLYTVTHWGDTQFLLLQYWPVPVFIICEAVVAAIVQGYLASRFIRLTRNWIIGFVLYLLILTGFGSSIAVAILIAKRSSYAERIFFGKPLEVWLITDTVCNACIACALISVLYVHRPVFKPMDTIISRLMINAFESGCIPAIFATGTLISYIISPTSNLTGIFFLPLSHLYALTLLYTLNIRKSLRRTSADADDYYLPEISAISAYPAQGDGVANQPTEQTNDVRHHLSCFTVTRYLADGTAGKSRICSIESK